MCCKIPEFFELSTKLWLTIQEMWFAERLSNINKKNITIFIKAEKINFANI